MKKEKHTIENLKGHLKTIFMCGIYDHNGEKYDSIEDMCKKYHMTYDDFYKRAVLNRQLKWTLKQILETPVRKKKVVYDHKGNVYRSFNALSTAYGLSTSSVKYRLNKGMTLEEALTTPSQKKGMKVLDHLGNEFDSVILMCQAYGVTMGEYDARRKQGFSVREALTTKSLNISIDDYGNIYENVNKLAEACNINAGTYKTYHRLGYSVEDMKVIEFYRDHADIFGRVKINWLREKGLIGKGTFGKTGIELELAIALKMLKLEIKEIEIPTSLTLGNLKLSGIYEDGKLISMFSLDTNSHFIPNSKEDNVFKKTEYKNIVDTTYLKEFNVPIIRIRFTQVGNIYSILKEALSHLDLCKKQHNPRLTNKEYWSIRQDFDEVSFVASEKTLDEAVLKLEKVDVFFPERFKKAQKSLLECAVKKFVEI